MTSATRNRTYYDLYTPTRQACGGHIVLSPVTSGLATGHTDVFLTFCILTSLEHHLDDL